MLSRQTVIVFILVAVFITVGQVDRAMADVFSELRHAPEIAQVPKEKLGKAEIICSPKVRTLLGYTRRILHLRDGHTLAVFSYSGGKANWLFLIDTRDMTVKRIDTPYNDKLSHSAALGSDGNIYNTPYYEDRAYKFDVKSCKFSEIKIDAPHQELTWDALGASNDCIYYGTYPNACFGEYNIRTGKTTQFEHVAPNSTYVTGLREEADGRIRLRAWGPDDNWMTFDPKTREFTKIEAPVDPKNPDAPKGDEFTFAPVNVGDRKFVLSFPTSRLWEIEPDGKLVLRGDPKAPAEYWYLETVPGALIGISHFGIIFRYDLATGKMLTKQIDNFAPGGNIIMFLEAISQNCILGGNYSQNNLFSLNPKTGHIAYGETVSIRSGQANCAVGFGGKAYVGTYIQTVISRYDPKKPFEFGKNPTKLAELGAEYHQTRPKDAVCDGNLVYISSDSEYNHLGGALVVIDPRTDKIDVHHQLIKDQNLPSLAYDPVTKLVWGGTDRWGQMRSCPPTQESSLIYSFDPKTRKVVDTIIIWPGSDITNVLGISQNGILTATNGAEISLFDTVKREVLYKGASPIAIPSKIKRGRDGSCYCLADGVFYRWDFAKNTLTPLAETPGCVYLTETKPGEWILANFESVYKIKIQ